MTCRSLAQGPPWGIALALLGLAAVTLAVGLVALVVARRGR